MGKYMRKARRTGEVAVMEVSQQSAHGVRTRARTLALQRLQAPTSPPASPDPGSYILLRSRRRLEKPLAVPSRPSDTCKAATKAAATAPERMMNPKPGPVACSANSDSLGSASVAKGRSEKGGREEASVGNDGGEASYGENVLESEGSNSRNVRETTPCSLIRLSEITGTSGSTTRPRPTSSGRRQGMACRNIPTTDEMEYLFDGAEKLQQRIFREKYNFDPVNDCPLPGRYEWVKLDSQKASSPQLRH